MDEPLRRDHRGARRASRPRRRPPTRRSPRSRTTSGGSTACSSTPRSSTRRTAWRCCARFLHERAPAARRRGRWRRSSTSRSTRDPRPGRRRPGASARCRGGVDSSVAAALVHRAIGHQLTCVYVDTGLMRKGESEQVVETFRRNHGHRADPRRRRRPLLRRASPASPTRRTSARRSASCSSASSRSTPAA